MRHYITTVSSQMLADEIISVMRQAHYILIDKTNYGATKDDIEIHIEIKDVQTVTKMRGFVEGYLAHRKRVLETMETLSTIHMNLITMSDSLRTSATKLGDTLIDYLKENE